MSGPGSAARSSPSENVSISFFLNYKVNAVGYFSGEVPLGFVRNHSPRFYGSKKGCENLRKTESTQDQPANVVHCFVIGR